MAWTWWNDGVVFGMSPANIALAVGTGLLAWLLMRVGLRVALARLERASERTASRTDDIVVEVLAGTNRWLMALVAALITVGMLDLSARWASRVEHLWFLALAVQLALWLNRAVSIGLRLHVARHAAAGMAQATVAATLVSWGLRTLLWSVVLLAILSNVGVNITAFVASLGVGGIAVALAAQNILGDLFASLSIAVDKPFEVGDFIALSNGSLGTVEHVGVKTTRLRSLSGEQIVMGNTDLLKQTVQNYRRMMKRRIVFGFTLPYTTPRALAAEVPELVKQIVSASERVVIDRAHLLAFSETGYRYEVVYIVQAPDYNVYMDEQQRINFALMEAFEARGIEFAVPVRRVDVASLPEGVGAAAAPPPVSAESPAPGTPPAAG